MRRWQKIVIFALALALGGSAWLMYTLAQGQEKTPPPPGENLSNALQVIALLKTQYYEPVNVVELLRAYMAKGSINGMLAATLDEPYTRFLDRKAYAEMQMDIRGNYGGLGMYIAADKEGRVVVTAPIEGTPAARAGVRSGDLIVEINGKSTEYMSTDQAASLMRGPAGTKVTITIERRGGKRLNLTLTRENIHVPTVKSKLLPGEDRLGYLQIIQFGEETAPDARKAMEELDRQGARGLIVDLRFNPGGLLQTAVQMVSMFVPRGPVVYIVDRFGRERVELVQPQGYLYSKPVVVLVNKWSASAAEIFSGALKDTGRATLVGSQTFGKGLVQSILSLPDGSGLSLTTHYYLTAGRNAIHKKGITPNVVVKIPEEEEGEKGLPAVVWTLKSMETDSQAEAAKSGGEEIAPQKRGPFKLYDEQGKIVREVPAGTELRVVKEDKKKERWGVKLPGEEEVLWIAQEDVQYTNPVDVQLKKAIEVLKEKVAAAEKGKEPAAMAAAS